MDLLFRREQSSGTTGGVKFKLWGKIELEETETQLISRYDLDKAILIVAMQPLLMRRSAYIGGAVFIVVFAFFLSSFGAAGAAIAGTVAGAAAGYFYYDRNRETIYVRDLMHGRYFSCDSVVELARKEAWLATIVAFLRQVMESAKHWDGTEAVPIPALSKEDAKALIVGGI